LVSRVADLRATFRPAAGPCNRKPVMSIISSAAFVVALAAGVSAAGQDQGQYRDFQLGASVATISTLTETRSADVTVVHERPAVMQELRWIPSSSGAAGRSRARGGGLQQIVFSFYENQLYRLMIDYERSETKGMTDRDMVDAISAVYGQPSSSKIFSAGTDVRAEEVVVSRVVARWNGPGYAVAVSRWAYGGAWRLVIESMPLAELAHTADARALVLDIQEGPQREAERARREQQGKDDAETAARTANRATFKP
jgi:hypothetical protein